MHEFLASFIKEKKVYKIILSCFTLYDVLDIKKIVPEQMLFYKINVVLKVNIYFGS